MIDYVFLFGAIAIMGIIILREILRKKCNFDMDSVDVSNDIKNIFNNIKLYFGAKDIQPYIIKKNTGDRSLSLINTGNNKLTVLATLRQITDIGLKEAKSIVDNAPCDFMQNISDEEADLTKKALEFVGAQVEIK